MTDAILRLAVVGLQVIAQEKAELEARATRAEAEIRGFRAETEWERNEMQNKVAKLQKAVAQSAAKLERKNEKLEALKKKSEEKVSHELHCSWTVAHNVFAPVHGITPFAVHLAFPGGPICCTAA